MNQEKATQIMLHVHQKGSAFAVSSPTKSRKPKSPKSWILLVSTNILCNVPWRRREAMLSKTLENTLHQALDHANELHHEYATLEHLLFALTEDQDAIAVLRACGVDLERLRGDLRNYITLELSNLVGDEHDEAKPTAGFQRVIQRAVIHVQSSGRAEVTGANVLVALFSERESHAVFYLQEQDMSRFDASTSSPMASPKCPVRKPRAR